MNLLTCKRLSRRLMRLGVMVELYGEGRSYHLSVCCNDAEYFFNQLGEALQATERSEDTTREFVVTALWATHKCTLATFHLARRRLTPSGPLELAWVATEGGHLV